MTYIFKLCSIFILLILTTSCTTPTKDITFFENQLSTLEKVAGNKGEIQLQNQNNWNYFLICSPYSNVEYLKNTTTISQQILNKITQEMEKSTFNRVYLINEANIISQDIKTININIDENPGWILIEKQTPFLYYLVPQQNLIYLYKDIQFIKTWKSRKQINEERLLSFQGKGTILNYMSQQPYPDVSTPESLIKTFFKAWKENDNEILMQCIFPNKNAEIFLKGKKQKEWTSIRLLEIQNLPEGTAASYENNTKATHRVIVTLHQTWDTLKSIDVPYSYYVKNINGKWQIISWTVELDYGS